ncbi:MAG: aconitase X [Anaerolineae bacterium]
MDSQRQAEIVVEVRCPVRDVADFGALSYVVGQQVGSAALWFADLADALPPLPADITAGGAAGDRLKTLGAGLAAYGAVALFHIAGYTPEARDLGERLIKPDARRLTIDSLDPGYTVMDADPDLRQIDLVTIGCPHASLSEMEQIAALLQGQRVKTQLWVTTARITRDRAREAGWVQAHRGSRRPGGGRHLRRGRTGQVDRHHQHGHQRRQDGLLRAGPQQGQDALRQPGAVRGGGCDRQMEWVMVNG